MAFDESLINKLCCLGDDELRSRFRELGEGDEGEMDAIVQILRGRRLTRATAGASLDDVELLAKKLKGQVVLDPDSAALTTVQLASLVESFDEAFEEMRQDVHQPARPC